METFMHQDHLYGHDEPLSWRDIEALPFYLAAALLAFFLVHGLMDEGLALRLGALKGMAIVGMLGLYQVWSDMAAE
jgi:hypothetical protein